MAGSNRRLAYERAKEHGTEIEEWVIKQTSNWDNPVVSFEEVSEKFDMDDEELLDQLISSEMVDSRSIGDQWVFW
ncbi:hypothetical protein [Natronococcus sp. A-GB7]|uniref:hypothetical protein n=1 Tax=Natronococcus sp. A-GB7 TaxID=3037649 RepID=UPI00241D0CC0|nr:hypothetical protein [Natronococcus sp. A-GB7]MDG5821929.1 hypothetical protein [Natronococcus sp. A-GB7]